MRVPCFSSFTKIAGLRGQRTRRTKRSGTGQNLRKQLFSRISILDDDRAHRAVLGSLKDLLLTVAGGVDRLRLAIVVEPEHIGRIRLAHCITDAEKVVDPNAQLAGHRYLPIASGSAAT